MPDQLTMTLSDQLTIDMDLTEHAGPAHSSITPPALISFFVPGKVKGEPRCKARAFRNPKAGGKWMSRTYPDASADDWRGLVAWFSRPHRPEAPIEGPVRVDLKFVFERPKGHYGTGKNAGVLKDGAPRFHAAKPDRDNSDKLLLDVLTQMGFWRDDAQVAGGQIWKVYQQDASDPIGVYVKIWRLDDE